MRRSSQFVFLAFSLLALAAEKPNFSGAWELDKSRSENLGRMAEAGGLTLVIEHNDTTLSIERKISFGGEERSQKLTYTTDGKENTNPGMMGGQAVSKSRWDGDKLVIEGKQAVSRGGNQFTIEFVEVYWLSDDGKTLTIESTRTTPRGEQKSKQVYSKKD